MKTWSFERSIVVFGAGKIGRSFIGQLFSRSGYKVIFIDIDLRIIKELNRRKSYNVVIKSKNEEVWEITNFCGILANDIESIINAIANCDLMATSVGKNAFTKILPVIAKGVEKRITIQPNYPLDIILAENIRDACQIMKNGLKTLLAKDFPINSYLGFIETSIGKMVPIIPKEIENKDSLLVYAESYNTLILDKKEFKNPIPKVAGLSPKENIKAWVDRKAFIHNLGHAAAAYFGYFKYPERKYLYEVLADKEVYSFTREAMKQSANALINEYPNVFTVNDLDTHIDDLICRFQNKALCDTVFRVGYDLKRKLSAGDRVVGAIKLAQKTGNSFDRLIEVLIYGLLFRAKNEFDHLYQEDIEFIFKLQTDVVNVLTSVCGFDNQLDMDIINNIKTTYKLLSKKKLY